MKYRQLLDNSAILRQRNIDTYWYKKKRKGGGVSPERDDKANSSGKRENVNRRNCISHLANEFIKLIISIIDLDRVEVKYKPLFLRWNDIFTREARLCILVAKQKGEKSRRNDFEEWNEELSAGRTEKSGKRKEEGAIKVRPFRVPRNLQMRLSIELDSKSRRKRYRCPLSTFVSSETPSTRSNLNTNDRTIKRQLNLPEVVRMAVQNVIDTQWYTPFAFSLNYIPTSRPLHARTHKHTYTYIYICIYKV